MEANQTALTVQYAFGQTSAILTESSKDTTTVVILCHGFLSNKNSRTNVRLTELLVPQGLSTLGFDWFGMGDSSGQFTDITIGTCQTQLESVIADIKKRGYQHIGLIGSSFGGLLAILVGAEHPEFFAIGLKCPVADFPEMLELEFGQEGLSTWRQTNTIPNVIGGQDRMALNFDFFQECRQYHAYAQAKKIRTPCLIIHGEHDELVPLHQIHQLYESLAGEKKLLLLPEANHHFGRPEDFRAMSVALKDWMVTHRLSPPATSQRPS